MSDRGIIRSKEYASNLILFEGLQWGNITPTDIDAVVDFQNKLFVFIEVKYGKTKLTTGQKILLERLADNLSNDDTVAVSMVCRHYQKNDVLLESCVVSKIRYFGKWYTRNNGTSIKEAIKKLRNKHLFNQKN